MMYKMKEVSLKTGIPYETLKFYCNEGLIPNVRRDEHNYRIFDDTDIAWISSLSCLKKCGMSIQEMKEYIDLCLLGPSSIAERKNILARKRNDLEEKMKEVQESMDFIDYKQQLYDDILAGRIEYHSNLRQFRK